MRVIAVSCLRKFWQTHPDAEQPLRCWVDEALRANWSCPTDITAQFITASVLKGRRVVFNIKGNDYRLITAVACRFGTLYIKFIGAHTQYDRIDANAVEMT
ncbi:MAG: type II toxin-antitoxin system HigB family toxin [Zoogloeaceae bacterium]|jgi:mRNA interferase HigB|nr:type II toxin-antitoxin system HigB family toxin [Zoogloeaceae bacterium]